MKKTTPKVKINLSGIMAERSLTVEKVVDLCNEAGTPISRGTVNNLTNPHTKGIYLYSLTALCNGLQVCPGDLFTIEEVK